MRSTAGFGAACVILGLAWAAYEILVPLWRARASRTWSETVCRIERSDIERAGTRETMYRANLQYRYEVGDRQLTGDRIDFADDTSYAKEEVRAMIAPYPAGATVPCWYDPAAPPSAVLSRTIGPRWWFVFPLVGIALGYQILRRHGGAAPIAAAAAITVEMLAIAVLAVDRGTALVSAASIGLAVLAIIILVLALRVTVRAPIEAR